MEEFFNGFSSYDIAFGSFMVGFISCMLFDVLLSLCNLLIERALYYRKKRKEV